MVHQYHLKLQQRVWHYIFPILGHNYHCVSGKEPWYWARWLSSEAISEEAWELRTIWDSISATHKLSRKSFILVREFVLYSTVSSLVHCFPLWSNSSYDSGTTLSTPFTHFFFPLLLASDNRQSVLYEFLFLLFVFPRTQEIIKYLSLSDLFWGLSDALLRGELEICEGLYTKLGNPVLQLSPLEFLTFIFQPTENPFTHPVTQK